MSDIRIANPVRRAFTLIELLMVVVIVLILAALVLVAVNRANSTAARFATNSTMNSIGTAIEGFRNDFGYIPPLINDRPTNSVSDRNDRFVLSAQRQSGSNGIDAEEAFRNQRFQSVTTLPLYLAGLGYLDPTGTNTEDLDRHDGVAGPGIRDPGPDRSWGGAADRTNHKATRVGPVRGPYVDASDTELIRRSRADDYSVGARPGADLSLDELYVFRDFWDSPIRYYVPKWRKVDPTTREQTMRYTPVEVIETRFLDLIVQDADATESSSVDLDTDLFGAEYVLLSAGPDRAFARANSPATEGMTPDGGAESTLNQYTSSAAASDFLRPLRDNLRYLP